MFCLKQLLCAYGREMLTAGFLQHMEAGSSYSIGSTTFALPNRVFCCCCFQGWVSEVVSNRLTDITVKGKLSSNSPVQPYFSLSLYLSALSLQPFQYSPKETGFTCSFLLINSHILDCGFCTISFFHTLPIHSQSSRNVFKYLVCYCFSPDHYLYWCEFICVYISLLSVKEGEINVCSVCSLEIEASIPPIHSRICHST